MGNVLDCSSGNEVQSEEPIPQQPIVNDATGPLVVESRKPVLESTIWKLQHDIFESMPIDGSAKNASSFSLSSNSYVAKCYASIILSYVMDWYSDPSNDISEPMYIIDIGAGFGKLGYLIMFRLFEMKEHWPESKHPPFIYVLTEVTSSYISHWEKNPLISQFIQLGYMDYGVFDIEKDNSFRLHLSNRILSPLSLKIPPFILCSSVLSFISQDVVLIENHEMKNGTLSLLQYPNIISTGRLDGYDFSWDYEVSENEYNEMYASLITPETAKEGKYVIPTRAFDMMNTILSWCNTKGIFLICDRGVFSDKDIDVVKDPTISKTTVFSLPVNFWLLDLFCHQQGGESWITSLNEDYRVLLAIWIDHSVGCMLSISRSHPCLEHDSVIIHSVQHSRYNVTTNFKQKCIQDESALSFDSILCLLRLSHFDPDLYFHYRQTISNSYPTTHQPVDMVIDLDHLRDHIYSYNKNHDVSFELARMYMGLGDYRTAIELFEDSLKYVEPHAVTVYNIGLCALYMNNVDYARQYFAYSLQLNPSYLPAQQKLMLLQQPLAEEG